MYRFLVLDYIPIYATILELHAVCSVLEEDPTYDCAFAHPPEYEILNLAGTGTGGPPAPMACG